MIQTRNYLAYDPKDSALPSKLAERFELEAKAAITEQQFGAAVLFSRSGQEFTPSEALTELRRKAEDGLAQWNRESAETEGSRKAAAQTPTKTVWTPIKGEVAQTRASSVNIVSKDFKVTDVGFVGEFEFFRRKTVLGLSFGDVERIRSDQVRITSASLVEPVFPGLEIDGPNWQNWKLAFLSLERRDQAKQAIEAAHKEWWLKQELGKITCTVTTNGLLRCEVNAISGGWTTPVSFPKRWRLAGVDHSYGFSAYEPATDKTWTDNDAGLPLTEGRKLRFKSRSSSYNSDFKLRFAMP